MSLSAFSIDISLPFFVAMAEGLSADLSLMPLIVTVYLFFLGIGQLLFGPLSDRIGRKPALAIGLLLFIAGATIAGLATSLSLVIAGRILQGFGTSAAVVLSRTILRDLFDGQELARHMAVATGIFSVGPIIAPLLGAGLIALGASWRMVFVAMIVYGIALLLMLVKAPETLNNPDATSLKYATLRGNFLKVVRHPQSRAFMVINAVTTISMIVIVATMAPLYANVFGITGISFALFFAVHAIGIIVGQFLNHRLIAKVGVVPTSIAAASVMMTAGILIILAELVSVMNPWVMSGLVTLFAVGFLSVVANSMSLVLQPHGRIAGFASSMQGAVAMLVSSVVGTMLSRIVQDNVVFWGLAIAVIPLISILLMLRWQYHTRSEGARAGI